jgi:two-component system, chemotaxis family, protein-glutamate methylesterase/glutaminase
MLEEKSEVLESALYMALNTLQESATMSERLATRANGQGRDRAAASFEERAREARRRAAVLRRILTET